MPEQPSVTVLVSPELIEQMKDEWSPPVQIQIIETPGVGTGWELIARRLYGLEEGAKPDDA